MRSGTKDQQGGPPSAMMRMSRLLRWTYSLALGLALTGLLGLTVMGLAGAVWADLDLVNHFRPFLFAAALAGLVATFAALPGWRIALAALGLTSLVVQGAFMAPTYASRVNQGAVEEGQPLTLVTLNLRYSNGDLAPAVDYVLDVAPDFVFLQEVSPASLERLNNALSALLPYGAHCVDRHYCNLAVLSRHPLSDASASYLGWRSAAVRPDLPAGDWRLADSHLPDPGKAAAGLAVAAELGGPVPLQLLNVHLSWPYPAAIQRRQFRWIAERLAELPSGPRILAGDFNATPWSFGLRGFDDMVAMERVTFGLYSWPAQGRFPLPLVPIDQVYISSELAARQVVRGPNVGSDHFPIVARLALTGASSAQ